MIVDASALLAVLLGEPDLLRFIEALARERDTKLAAPTWLEASLKLQSTRLPGMAQHLAELIRDMKISIVPFDEPVALAALEAYRRFGKGNHPAKLNFGDCMAYATARSFGEPLLYKGNDFPQTDIPAAIP